MVLNARQIRFCAEYAKCQNPTQAYVVAGFSEKGAAKSASRLLQKAEIQDEISKRLEGATNFSNLTVAKVLKNIEHGMEMAEDLGQTSAYMKGAELQAKYLCMLTERKELTGRAGGPMQVDATVRRGVLTQEERDTLKAKLKGVLD
jgi:hypothetical protein